MNQSKRPQINVIHFMLIAGVLAIVFAVLRSRPSDSMIGVTLLIALAYAGLFVTMLRPNPVKQALADLPDEPDDKITAIVSALARCNPYDVSTNATARYKLMQLYKIKKRYDEAVQQGRAILKMKGVKRDLENEIRAEIAICLDFLGRAEEAEGERLALDDGPDEFPDSFLGWQAQGKVLEKLNRFDEAAEAYERALELSPADNTAVRDLLLIRLVLATFNAGRPDQTMKWAAHAIEVEVSKTRLYQVHRMAGFACSKLGRLDEAQYHRQRAYEMAIAAADSRKIADSLASLADMHRIRGELDRADALCLEAEALGPDSARLAITIHATVLRSQGRMEEAVARLQQANKIGIMASATSERKVQAAIKKSMALYQVELGQLESAWENLVSATADAGDDPRLALQCEAAWARLLAQRGDREMAIQRTELVLQQLDEQTLDATVQLDCLEPLGRAMCVIGEFERAQDCWQRFLATTHPPIAEPVGQYHLGECRWYLGDPDGAKDRFLRATALQIDSLHARLASDRLRELAKADQKGMPTNG